MFDYEKLNSNTSDIDLEAGSSHYNLTASKSGVILKHLDFLFLSHREKYDTPPNVYASYALKGASSVVGCLAGLPFMSPAEQYGGDNLLLRYMYAVSTVLPFGALTAWSLFNYIEYLQHDVYSQHKSKKLGLVLAVIPLGLAGCAALPGSIISLRYNQNIAYSIIAFLNDFIVEACAYNLLLRKTYSKIFENNKHNVCLLSIKNQIKKRLDLGMHSIINKSSIEINEFLTQNKMLDFFLEDSNYSMNVVELIHAIIIESKPFIVKEDDSCTHLHYVFEYTNYCLSAFLPLVWGITVLTLVQSEIQEKTNSYILSWSTAILSSLSIYYIESYLTNRILSKAYIFSLSFISGYYQKSLSQKYHLKKTLALIALGIIMSCFSFAAKAEVIESYGGAYHKFFIPVVIGSTILFTMSAVLDCIPNFINLISEKFGQSEERCLAKCVKIINAFNITLENSSIKDFEDFLESLNMDRLVKESVGDMKLSHYLKLYKETCARQLPADNSLSFQTETIELDTEFNEDTDGGYIKNNKFKFFSRNQSIEIEKVTLLELSNYSDPMFVPNLKPDLEKAQPGYVEMKAL